MCLFVCLHVYVGLTNPRLVVPGYLIEEDLELKTYICNIQLLQLLWTKPVFYS